MTEQHTVPADDAEHTDPPADASRRKQKEHNMSETTDTTTEPADEAEVTADEGTQSTSTLAEDVQQADTPAEDAETFPRSYVERLRRENQRYRDQAAHADDYARRLHTELVRATGRLADPTDLPFDADHVADAGKMSAAIDALLDAKPHLAARRPAGDIGQGNRGTTGAFSLLDTLKSRV